MMHEEHLSKMQEAMDMMSEAMATMQEMMEAMMGETNMEEKEYMGSSPEKREAYDKMKMMQRERMGKKKPY